MTMSYSIVADENIPGLETGFAALGSVTRVNGRLLQRQQLEGADILLVRSVTRVNRELLEGSSIRFVGSATIGTDHLDTDYLDAQGIAWANAPGSNANSVVEYVLSAFARVDGLLEKLLAGGTVGIVGMGNVGSSLYHRLDAMGIQCLAYDPLLPTGSFPILSELDRVLAADAVCLHAPLTRGGKYPSFHLLGQLELQQLKEGALLLNAGRGPVIDNAALSVCLDMRPDLTVILDVWEHEPAIDLELLSKVFLATPHIAGYSLDGKLAGTQMIYQACCLALGQPETFTTQGAELTQLIELDASGIEALQRVIFASYDIAEDDQAMRKALVAVDGEQGAAAFDALRKHYPVRREFSHYRVASSDSLAPALKAYLRALGFVLTPGSES
jgi:erythronate-4-phosphate dehydrogenase